MVLGLLLLLLLMRRLTVDCGHVTLLAAVVTAPAAAHPAAAHWREDDLDAVHVGGEVGPWGTHAHLVEQAEQQEVEAGDELHPSPISLSVTHSPSGHGEVFISVRGCALTTGQWHAVYLSNVPQDGK